MRDFKKYAEVGKAKMPRQQEMNIQEYLSLKRMADDDPNEGAYKAITTAYNAGFEAGTRYGFRRKGVSA